MTKNSFYKLFFHTVCWVFVILPMLVFAPPHQDNGPLMTMIRISLPLIACVVFYLNYLWLVPKYFIGDKRNIYFATNAGIIILCAFCVQWLMDIMHGMELRRLHIHSESSPPLYMWLFIFIVRNVFMLALSAGIATMMRLALKWQQAEARRHELEIQKTEAELSNLRSQINPHFLLNTLNNIYALIAFDQDKAQKAVLSLSAMMRQMLYGTQDNLIDLTKEIEFLNNYIDLMRLRMTRNVKIDVNMNCIEPDIKVAPFIFISLVENAFKHGVSMTEPCFISVSITADAESIVCEIKNSNYPKTALDRSGHGIGLKQVARRLDLAYPGRYEWTKGVDWKNNTYTSKIVIYDTKLRNN